LYHLNHFRDKIAGGGTCVGPSVTFTDPLVSEALAPEADFLWIDTEHTPMTVESVSAHLLAARACRTPAFVRVPGSDTGGIKRMLDAGVGGIIVPQIASVQEVERIVADSRYPPAGNRGFGPRRPMDYGRRALPAYLKEADDQVFVSVQIERIEALEQVEDIARIPGLDSLVLGPMDLSASLGHLGEVDHPQVEAAMDRVITAARDAGVLVGMGMGAQPQLAAQWAERGVDWIQLGCDFEYLVNGAHALFEGFR